ncbi:ATP-dependent zinc protease family protein [Marinimicrobium locisalis]|uniref:ATP-dependent zinc protease family protein n=1 Tax=Marinimicrobium locisalis TaxID=546022 RepID=UPI0032219790
MNHCLWKSLLPIAVVSFLSACSSNYALVKKSDVSTAEQCLLAQQTQKETIARQQEQLSEALSLLQQAVELQQQGDTALRGFMEEARRGLNEGAAPECRPASVARGATANIALDKTVVGAAEPVLITDLDIIVPARVDTGAALSQLDARDIAFFERNGEEWVRFYIADPDSEETIEVERPRLRTSRASSEEGTRRPVVEMRITIGSLTQMAELVLIDRKKQDFPLVVGRNVLRDLMLVDVARKNITEPERQTGGH